MNNLPNAIEPEQVLSAFVRAMTANEGDDATADLLLNIACDIFEASQDSILVAMDELKEYEDPDSLRPETKTLIFYGSGDDTFGEYGVTREDVDNCGSRKPIRCIINCGERGRLMVVGQYMDNGCWMAGANKVDEDDIFPDWKISIRQSEDTPYSTELRIVVPADFKLEWYNDKRRVNMG